MQRKYVNEKFPHLLHGGDYNPEQWMDVKDVIWEADMRLMQEANCNEMTVGIFSWAVLEPKEGEYDFSFLDEIIEKIYKNGGRVILATPSGGKPRWMANKYPEVLRVRNDGRREHFDDRHNHCFTSPVYREKITQMNKRLSLRYGKHPAVAAWHISNEYGGTCYCPLCQNAFREFLRKKYDNDIEKLNKAYWATFWSHRFNNFEEIEAPADLTDSRLHGLNLDWRRFTTAQTIDFMKTEIAAVRSGSDIPVTHNFVAWQYDLNHWKIAEHLDFVSWDSYPDWHVKEQTQVASETAFLHDLYRSMKQRPYLLMESAPGCANWKSVNMLKRPDMDTLQSLQTIAHGGDSVQYFQWRKSRGSLEKFHGAVVDHAGTNQTRIFKAISETGRRLKIIDEVAGTLVDSKVALMYDWENMWALNDCLGFKSGKKYNETCRAYYKTFWENAVSVDFVNAHSDLSAYDLVVAPMLYMADKDTVERLSDYVNNGGTLYATYMLGMVDGTDLCHLGGFPADRLKDVFGIWNEETDSLPDDYFGEVSYNGKKYAAKDFCELIHSSGAAVLATYAKDFYSGMPALTCNEYGKGKAYYQAFRDCGDFQKEALQNIVSQLHIEGAIPAPRGGFLYGVTAHKRTDGETEYLFAENYSEREVKGISLGVRYTDMETGVTSDTAELPPYGIRIFKRKV
ncbi:MAG: beta-galactosidase [Bacillota bacterium]|nr:MAG: beta-galactosidase [Bacillota bacterium]